MWYIFRHGETFCNRNKVKQGHSKNSFLTFEGAIQAHMNGLKLKNIDEDFLQYKFICTPLERTYHTCQLIIESLGLNILPIQDELIISRSRGKLERYHEEELKKNFPEEWKNIQNNLWSYEFEGYENYKNSCIRLVKFIEKYKNEKNLVIVAHKGVNRNLMYFLQKSKEESNLIDWINNLSDEEGNFIIKDLKNKTPTFDQNYFYSWNGDKYEKI